jgi:uncharacterized protein YegL
MKHVIAAVLLLAALTACRDAPPEQWQSGQSAVKIAQPSPSQTASPPSVVPAWPPAPQGEVKLADNLLAANYYVVFDGSGSMLDSQCSGSQTKLAAAKDALKEFAVSVPADANLGLLAFTDGRIHELTPLAPGNRRQFAEAVQTVAASGDTPLKDAVSAGYARLEEQAVRQLGYGRYVLVVVTDGYASPGQEPAAKVSWMLERTPVELHTIGFCIGENHSLNMPGRTVYKAADNPAALRQGLADVLAEAETFDAAAFEQ